MKVLAIVLGSIAALVVLSIVALAIMIPIVSKQINAKANDPLARHATLAKIADFTIPPGFRVRTALDLGISQTATIDPIDRSQHSLVLQLTGQHFSASDDKTLLDRLTGGAAFASKLGGCELKTGAEDTIQAGGKAITLRALSCDSESRHMRMEVGIIHAKASTVQLIATYEDSPEDRSALVSFVKSMR